VESYFPPCLDNERCTKDRKRNSPRLDNEREEKGKNNVYKYMKGESRHTDTLAPLHKRSERREGAYYVY
jgi:hypothetical protein